MTNAEKQQRMIEWLTHGHLEAFGGYEHDYVIHGGAVIVADLDDAKERARTLIVKHDLAELSAWFDRAVEWLLDTGELPDWPDVAAGNHDYGDWSDAFWETSPRVEDVTG